MVVDTCYNGVDGGSFPVVVRLVGAGGIIFMEVVMVEFHRVNWFV